MKIKIFIGQLNIGGAENQAVILAKYLSEKKYDVELITLYPGGKYWESAKQQQLHVRSLFAKKSSLKIIRAINVFFALFKMGAETTNHSETVICSYADYCNLLAYLSCAFKKNIKLIWMIRRSYLRGLNSPEWKMYLAEKVCGYFSSRVSAIIYNSTAGYNYYTANFNFKNPQSIVLHNFIETENFQQNSLQRQTRAEHGLQHDAIVVGVFGRIIKERKGHDIFMKAFALAKADYPMLQALILGPGDESILQEIKNQASHLNILNDVVFLGARNDMAAMYNLIDILCSPSLSEGTSNVILEAMATEIPCVVTDVGDSKYVVGSENVVVSPNDANGLYSGIKKMIEMKSSWKKIGILNRLRMQELFSKEKIFSNIEKCLLK